MLKLDIFCRILQLNKKGESPGEIFFLLLFVIANISLTFIMFALVVKFNYSVELNLDDQRAQEVALRIAQNPWPCLAYEDPKEGRLRPYILNGTAFDNNVGVEINTTDFSKCISFSKDADIVCDVYIYYYEYGNYKVWHTYNHDIFAEFGRKTYFLPVAIRFSDSDIKPGGLEVICRTT